MAIQDELRVFLVAGIMLAVSYWAVEWMQGYIRRWEEARRQRESHRYRLPLSVGEIAKIKRRRSIQRRKR